MPGWVPVSDGMFSAAWRRFEMKNQVILYNPRCSKPGFHRMPLSLLRLAATLKGDVPVEIIDGNLHHETDPTDWIIRRPPPEYRSILGITIMPGPQLARAVPDLAKIRSACPGMTVIAGGYFPSIHWKTCLEHPAVDFVAVGEADHSFPALVNTLLENREYHPIPGIADTVDGTPRKTPSLPLCDPDQLPEIPYDLIDVERYAARTHLGRRTLSHHSSAGCPFACNFCAIPLLTGGCWRGESAERLLETTTRLVTNYSMDALEFHDNNFFVSERRIREYCRGLLDRKIKIRWWGEGRIDTMLEFDASTWELMARSGLAMVFVGAESGESDTLLMMNKGGRLTPESTLEFARMTARYGIIPELSFICGNPPDPAGDISRTIAFIRKIKSANPASEIILYRYDPVPISGAMWNAAETAGFSMPGTLEEWADDKWVHIHRRRRAEIPWIRQEELDRLMDFETVLNAYYPTKTMRKRFSPFTELALKVLSAWRYHLGYYGNPATLRFLQKRIAYRRPETSGF